MLTSSEPVGYCPVCGADVFSGWEWSDDEWRRYFQAVRTPICAECASLLIIDGGALRLPTEAEVVSAHLALDEIEAIQLWILEGKGIESRRVR
jgi:hypothetical protein